MRSVGIAVALSLVAVVSICLLLVAGGENVEETGAWSSRSLLALGPIRSDDKSQHRHGRVEYRYQQVNCEGSTTFPTVPTTGTVPTTVTVTAPPTVTVTVPPTVTGTTPPTVTVTVPPTTTTVTVTTTAPTTSPAPPLCVPPCVTTDLCFPRVCQCPDNLACLCVVQPVVCNDNNRCTVDTCVNGTCRYVYNETIPGCSCVGFNCPSNGCFPSECRLGTGAGQRGPFCFALPPFNCSDNNNCTDDVCTFDPLNVTITNCSNTFNATLCPAAAGGLAPGQIAGIVIGAVAAAAIAAAIAAWARRTPSVAPATATTTTTPLATASPLYSEPVNAGVMPN